jgi:hypothetical protein
VRALSASARPVLLGCPVFVALLAGPVRAGKGASTAPRHREGLGTEFEPLTVCPGLTFGGLGKPTHRVFQGQPPALAIE